MLKRAAVVIVGLLLTLALVSPASASVASGSSWKPGYRPNDTYLNQNEAQEQIQRIIYDWQGPAYINWANSSYWRISNTRIIWSNVQAAANGWPGCGGTFGQYSFDVNMYAGGHIRTYYSYNITYQCG